MLVAGVSPRKVRALGSPRCFSVWGFGPEPIWVQIPAHAHAKDSEFITLLEWPPFVSCFDR